MLILQSCAQKLGTMTCQTMSHWDFIHQLPSNLSVKRVSVLHKSLRKNSAITSTKMKTSHDLFLMNSSAEERATEASGALLQEQKLTANWLVAVAYTSLIG